VRAYLQRHGVAGGSIEMSSICAGMSRSWGTHEGMGSTYEGMKGHLVTVLREPSQQIISAYHDLYNSWPYNTLPRDLREYAEAVQGFSVKMLARDGRAWPASNLVYDGRRPSLSETRLAVRRLREGFAFVGLTERFALTVCLLHRMFGGECQPQELRRFHQGRRRSGERYDTTALGGFRDLHGGAVYREAVRIFEENLRLYNVSASSCGPCFHRAECPEAAAPPGDARP